MSVFVVGLNGTRLMPTSERKARILLNQKKAEIYCRRPFAIRLLYQTGAATQSITAGIDTGSQHIGAAVVTNQKAPYKAEIELRSTMEKRALLEKRKEFRRNRRYRKTRYRHPKFRPRTKRVWQKKLLTRKSTKHKTHWKKLTNGFTSNRPEGWLPPSMQSKVDQHIQWTNRFLNVLPACTRLRMEVGRFDIARIKDPTIHNEQYQKGSQYDYENVKAYVFDRDQYKCRVCHAKAGSKRKDGTIVKIRAHHIDFKSKAATDNPDRMATVCDRCHTLKAHQPGGVLYDWMEAGKTFSRGYRDATMMNIIRNRLMNHYEDAEFTYGNITAADRKAMLLEKSHANDAVAIAAMGKNIKSCDQTIQYRQFRKKKRSLHEATPRKGRSEPNREAKRNDKNTKAVGIFHLGDTVSFENKRCWIVGFTGASAYLKDQNNQYITEKNKSYKQVALSKLKLVCHNNNWLTYTT